MQTKVDARHCVNGVFTLRESVQELVPYGEPLVQRYCGRRCDVYYSLALASCCSRRIHKKRPTS